MNANRPWLQHYPRDVPPDLPIPSRTALDVFRDTVRAHPNRPAIHYFDTTLTFIDLDRLSDALAAALTERGVRHGDRVVLALQNVPAFPIAQYAIWKCGAVTVPLNPMLRHQELLYQLRDCGACVLISLASLLDVTGPAAAEAGVGHVISVGDRDFLTGELPVVLRTVEERAHPEAEDLLDLCHCYAGRPPPDVHLAAEDIAYLVYTSGTTGPPKGAINTHRNVAYNAGVHEPWMRLGPGDVILGGAPLFHITGLIQHLAVSAWCGIPVVLAYRFEPGEILRLAERFGATFTVMAITAYIALLNHPDIERRDLSSLTKAFSGGAPIPPAVVELFRARTGVTIHPVYGLTETTSPSHAVPLQGTPPIDPAFGALSIGLPIPGAHCRVVDLETGRDVPPGSPGEIAIKGPMIVPGYWQKPGESAQAIRDGWLYTGDVGVMDEEGWFYIVDRLKDLIIASGYKVWPREVEEVLYTHPAVREAAVVGVPDAYRGETVKAYVALRDRTAAEPEHLIAYCRERLAAYKVPRLVEIVDDVPKTATGKFSRRTLRERAKEQI